MTIESNAHAGMLKTKYSVPSSGKRLLPRRVLNEKLGKSLDSKLTLITAPAGYGKTSAVLKWLESVPVPHAWLSIDAGDNDIFVFWRYFCAALDTISVGISRDTEYVFASGELFDANAHLSILVDKLSSVPLDFVLILDDIHLIKNHAIFSGLSYLLTYLPANMHMVFISRTEPRMNIAKLVMNEDLVRIGINELRFDTKEIARYYETRGYFLQTEEIKKIESYTEGWAAALVAVALSLKDEANRRTVISSFGGCNRRIESYLSEDVFNMWTKEQQEFMKNTSILDRLCEPLCEAVAASGGGLLKELYDQNSFLVPMDNEGIWFKYHYLFSDFLKKRLYKKDRGKARELHRRAGAWLEVNSFSDEAIEHYFNGAYYDEALLLIEKQASALVRHGEYRKAMSWIEKLPEGYIEKSPRIMLVKILYLTSTGDFKNALEHMKHVEFALKERNNLSDFVQKDYWLVKANLQILQGNIDESLSSIKKAVTIADIENKPYVDFNLYDISMYRCPYRIIMEILKDRPGDYEALCIGYRSLIVSHPGYFQLMKGETCYESGKLSEAVPELIAAVDDAMEAGCPGVLVPAMVTLAKTRRAGGDIPGAMEMITECERRLAEFHKPHWGYMLRAFKARLYIDTDDAKMIDKWINESRLSLFQEITAAREYELIVLARVFIYKHRYQDAIILLNRLLNFAEGQKRNHSIVEISILLAITTLKNLSEDTALRRLEPALAIGSKEGYVSSFADELAPMIPLLELYIGRHSNGNNITAYTTKLLIYTKINSNHLIFSAGLNVIESRLTPTERKVLWLIKDTYTNQDIADELGITLRTVKAHTGSIYKKLGVKNRVQCIKKVR